jgi:FkbM family methyltransferase
MSIVNVANKFFGSLGFRVTRNASPNRFEAMEHTLRLMAERGFAPAAIVDAGANVGNWTRMARTVFPGASFHMIEPQSGCAPILESIVNSLPRIGFYRTAVTRPGRRRVLMTGGGNMQRGTGAWVLAEGDETIGESESEATTLDELFADGLPLPIFLKLDLEGHELAALEGAQSLLTRVEAVLTEVSFFDIHDSGRPLFSDVLAFLRDRGFDLYDISSLSGRHRDNRLCLGDAVFVRRDSPLSRDKSWE